MSTTVKGASLAFEAKQIRVDLADLFSKNDDDDVDDNDIGLSAPEFEVPQIDEEDLPLDALGELALKEILAHARSGEVEVRLPLKPVTIRKGPFSFTLPDQAEVIVELKVTDGIIIREETMGRIEPALQLPLGVQLRGVYLDDDGSLFAELSGFPDLNLSWLALSGLKVPRTLKEVLEKALGDEDTRFLRRDKEDEPTAESHTQKTPEGPRLLMDSEQQEGHDEVKSEEGFAFTDVELVAEEDILGDEPQSDSAADDDSQADDVPIDLLRLSVQARDVLPFLTPLVLGHAGSLVPGDETRLDVDFTLDEIHIWGEVELEGGAINAGGFSVEGLVGKGALDWTLKGVKAPTEMSLDFRCDEGQFASAKLALKDGTRVVVDDVAIRQGRIQLLWGPSGVRFDVDSGRAQGRLSSGDVFFQLGQKRVHAHLAPCIAEGSLKVSNDHFSVDVEVEEAGVSVEKLFVPLGVASFDLQRLDAQGRGRLRAATDMGFAFSGLLHAKGQVLDANVALGPVRAHLVEGSDAQFSIREFAVGNAGLEALVAQGQLDVRLASGQLPLTETLKIQFSRGGMGRITFDELRYFPDQNLWPSIRGSGTMMARADAVDVESVLLIPAGSAHIQLGEFVLGDEGVLELNALRTWLRSDDAAGESQ